jgi:hypothetical protein
MLNTQKLEMLKALSGESDENILLTSLYLAKNAILHKAFPFGTDEEDVPEKYVSNQLEIACYLINKRGGEGEISHSENGVSRSYESAGVPPSMLKDIIPTAGVIT